MRLAIRLARVSILLALTAGPGVAVAASPPPSAEPAPGGTPVAVAPKPPAAPAPPAGPGPAAQAAPATSDVPDLPFDDNPDPDQCGIPQPLGDGVRGEVTGR